MVAVTICVRVDVYSVIYAIILGILLVLSRRGNAIVWPLITIILAVMLPVQFLICLGLPTGLCLGKKFNQALFIQLFDWIIGGRAGVHSGFRTITLDLYIGSLPNLAT